jgi:autotransporter-associated beta strand protein
MKQPTLQDRSSSPAPTASGSSLARCPRGLLAALACLLALTAAQGAPITWSGLSSSGNDWSDTLNWLPASAPGAADTVIFTNAGSTTVRGTVNNTVSSDVTVSNLFFTQVSNYVAASFHTTAISDGATLAVNSAIRGTNASLLFVGTDVTNAPDQVYATITGAGTLSIGSLVLPNTNNDLMVSVRYLTANPGGHKATLDMSGLNKFTFGGGRFQVSANGISTIVGQDRPSGSVLLAKTNIITCARPRADQYPFAVAPFAICSDRYCNPSTNVSLLELGQENTINAESITVAGARASNGTMKFRSGLTSPTLKLRGADGISRMAEMGIGENELPVGASVADSGTVDLSLGVTDALIETLDVGRNNGILSTATYNTGANGTGALTIGGGTFDVTTVNIGCQGGNNGNKATGTITVRTGGTLAAGTINIGRDAGGGPNGGVVTGTGVGTLTINGGTVKVSGDLVENDAPEGNGTSTVTLQSSGVLDMMPAGDTVPGNITVDLLKLYAYTLTNYNTLSVSNIALFSPATSFTLYPGQALAPFGKGTVGTLLVNGNGGGLNLAGGTVDFDLVTPGASDTISVSGTLTLSDLNNIDISGVGGTLATGTYTLMTAAGLTGDSSNLRVTGALADSRYTFAFDTTSVANTVNLVVGGSTSALTWSGDGGANLWNVKGAANWNNQTEQFWDFDSVTFDDTAANRTVTLSGTLQAGSVTVASANNYTFAGSGKVSCGALNFTGTGTATLGASTAFTAPVNVNAGTLLANGTLNYAPVTVASGATLGGNGAIFGPVTVQTGGTLSPSGTMVLSNNLTLASGSTTVFKANLTTLAQDQVAGLNLVTYGGTLKVVLSGRGATTNDTFKLFSIAAPIYPLYTPYSGSFSSIVPATPGPGLGWSTSTLTADGTLRVVRVVNTTPTNLTSQLSGNQLTLSWPADHTGWHLQSQTNAVSVGLSTNWAEVAGSTATNTVTVTINPANGSVFYRMTYP